MSDREALLSVRKFERSWDSDVVLALSSLWNLILLLNELLLELSAKSVLFDFPVFLLFNLLLGVKVVVLSSLLGAQLEIDLLSFSKRSPSGEITKEGVPLDDTCG